MSISIEEFLAGAVQQLLGEAQAEATQATLDTVLSAVNATLSQINSVEALLTNGTFGLSAIESRLATFQATTAIDFTAVLTAIAAAQQSGSPVTLPSSPPGGGGWVDPTNLPDLVWNTLPTGHTVVPITPLISAGRAGELFSGGYLDYNAQWAIYKLTNTNPSSLEIFPSITYPVWDPSSVSPSQTLLAAVTAMNPTWGVAYADPPANDVFLTAPDAQSQFVTRFDEAGFALYKQGLFGGGMMGTAPIWPGLAGVTLGTPVAITSSFTITADCDGALVSITGVPSKQGQFAFGDLVSWRNIGALAFVNDDGDAEFPQTLGFTSAVYCPKAMAHASGLVVRASAGVTGTVTPWTIS